MAENIVNILFTISKLFSLVYYFFIVPEVHTSLKCVLTDLKIHVKAHHMYFYFDNFLCKILKTVVNLIKNCFL